MKSEILNLFYSEPDPDRWIPYDRYPRRFVRRLIRGKRRIGGQEMVFLNLLAGLSRLGIPYRVNDYHYACKHPNELVGIIGKPHVLFKNDWQNPVLFGASVFSHPFNYPDLFNKYPVKVILVPGPWIADMFRPYYGDKVQVWPVGIDTEYWSTQKLTDYSKVLVYDKIRWNRNERELDLFNPIIAELQRSNIDYEVLRYGFYDPSQLKNVVQDIDAAIFICEHETQGLAYQQILSSDIPIFAWDHGGMWIDPEFYPDFVKYQPVTSVPYFDDRCGMIFKDAKSFKEDFSIFWSNVKSAHFQPREYILENLTLEKCAEEYLRIYSSIQDSL
ncbi:MAG: hypothetical protein V3U75_09745 [Methylococcaceae bacterium]